MLLSRKSTSIASELRVSEGDETVERMPTFYSVHSVTPHNHARQRVAFLFHKQGPSYPNLFILMDMIQQEQTASGIFVMQLNNRDRLPPKRNTYRTLATYEEKIYKSPATQEEKVQGA